MKLNDQELNTITRILSGDAPDKEKEQYFKELETNPDKKVIFQKMEKEWITASDAMLFKSLDVNAAWDRQKDEYINQEGTKERNSSIPYFLKWAAAVVMILGLGYYLIDKNSTEINYTNSYHTGFAENLPVNTADGSVITLNQNTNLQTAFTDQLRKVNLTGEAYFNVAPDPEHPFVIDLKNAYVKVIGTSFNLKTDGQDLVIIVNEGLVELGIKNNREKSMIPAGKMGKITDGQLVISNIIESNALAWYSKELTFDKTPLPKVLADLSQTYYVNFQFDEDQLANCHLTADFSKEKLVDIIETIHTIFGVDVVKNDNAYIVKGDVCN